MIESILSILVDIGLIRKDYKHRKKIREQEAKKGIKRPIKKYLMQPSFLIAIGIIGSVIVGKLLYTSLRTTSPKESQTLNELKQIEVKLAKWNSQLGHYPNSLKELIGNNPLRRGWDKDAWNLPYKYEVSENKNDFLLISAGSDSQFDTEDDLKLE